ncbi:MAG: ergothioneine biosynthesis protein EgtB [Nannocystaceae bacterium]
MATRLPHTVEPGVDPDAAALLAEYLRVRAATEALAAPLSPEDQLAQSMTEASPVKWHLAHTTWFFDTFVLEAGLADYAPLDPSYRHLFNSYYVGVGTMHARPARGLLTRPSLAEVRAYRAHVDREVTALLAGDVPLARGDAPERAALLARVELGLHHEQQHQELILTDLKHLLAQNPTQPVYVARPPDPPGAASSLEWHPHAGGLLEIGHDGRGFAFDNERPRHRVFLEPFALAGRLVTCGEYRQFIADGGYARPELWLSDGWDAVRRHGWRAPLYWELERGSLFTLAGARPLDDRAPVCHVSFYEADAYARWADARLPTEAEWELIASTRAHVEGSFADDRRHHPAPAREGLAQLLGDCWEWTASGYAPYPGFRPLAGALGEYNGKFMCNQLVLRGGSCATPRDHVRTSYRNFFYPDARWQFSGIRLAKNT